LYRRITAITYTPWLRHFNCSGPYVPFTVHNLHYPVHNFDAAVHYITCTQTAALPDLHAVRITCVGILKPLAVRLIHNSSHTLPNYNSAQRTENRRHTHSRHFLMQYNLNALNNLHRIQTCTLPLLVKVSELNVLLKVTSHLGDKCWTTGRHVLLNRASQTYVDCSAFLKCFWNLFQFI